MSAIPPSSQAAAARTDAGAGPEDAAVSTPAVTPLDQLERTPVARSTTTAHIDARANALRGAAPARDAAAVAGAARVAALAAWRGLDLEARRDRAHVGARDSAAIQAAIAIERARASLNLAHATAGGAHIGLDAAATADQSGLKADAKLSGRASGAVGDVKLDGSGDVSVDHTGNVRGAVRGSAAYDSGDGTTVRLDVDGNADASGVKGNAKLSGRTSGAVGDVKLDGSGDVSVDHTGNVRGAVRGSAAYDSGDGTTLRLDVDGSGDANGVKGNAKLSGRTSGAVGDVKLDGSGDVSVDHTGNMRGAVRGSAAYDSGDGTTVRLDVDGSGDANGVKGNAKLSGRTSGTVGDVKLDGSGDVSVDHTGNVRGAVRGSAVYDSGDGTTLRLDVDGSGDANGVKGNAKLSGRTSGAVGDVMLDGSGDVGVDHTGNVRGAVRGSAAYDSGDGTTLRLDVDGSGDANGVKGNAKLSGRTSGTVGDVKLDGSGDVSVDHAGAITGGARVAATTTMAGARVDGGAGVRVGSGGPSGDVTARASLGQGKAITSVDGTLKVDSGGVRADANVRWERQVGSGSAGVQVTTERVGATGTVKLSGGAQLDGSVGVERNAVDATVRARGDAGDLGARIAFGRARREVGGDATTTVTLGSFQGRALVRGRVGKATEAKDLGLVDGGVGAPAMRAVLLERSTVTEAGAGLGVMLAGAVLGGGVDGRKTARASWRTTQREDDAQAMLADPTRHELPSLARPASIGVGDVVTVVTEGELSLYVEAGVLGATGAGRASVAGELAIKVERRSDDVVRVTVAPTTIHRAAVDGKAVVLTASLSAAQLRGLSHTFDLDLTTRAGREAYAAAMCGRLPGPDELPSSAVALVDELNATLPHGVRAIALAEERARTWAVSGSLAYLLVGMTFEVDETSEESRTAESGKVTLRRGSSRGTTRKSLLSGTAQARVSAEVITEQDAAGARVRGVSLVARFVDEAMRPAELERIVSELRDATGTKLPSFAGVSGERREIELELLIDADALASIEASASALQAACTAASLDAGAASGLLDVWSGSRDVGRRADALVDFVQEHGLRGLGAVARAWPQLPLSLRGRTDAYARALADAQALVDRVFHHPSTPEAWLFFERATAVAPVLLRIDQAIEALERDPFFDDVDGKLMDELCAASVALADCIDLRHLSEGDVRELFVGLHTAHLLHPPHAYGIVLAEMQARSARP